MVVTLQLSISTATASITPEKPMAVPPQYQKEILQRLKSFVDIHRVRNEKEEIRALFQGSSMKDKVKLAQYKKTDFFAEYESTRHWLADEVNLLKNEYQESRRNGRPTDEIAKRSATLFVTAFNILFEFWDGTDYDFNGNTHYPQYGKVACGVFLYRLMKVLGVPSLDKIKSNAEIYRQQKDPVWLWQASPQEQIQGYLGGKLISSKQCEGAAHLPCLMQKLHTDGKEPFYLVGIPCHVFMVTRDLYGTLHLFHALNTTEKRVLPDVKNVCSSDEIFVVSWRDKDFEKWFLGFKAR